MVIRDRQMGINDVLRTYGEWVGKQLEEFLWPGGNRPANHERLEVIPGGCLVECGLLVNEITRLTGDRWFDGMPFNYDPGGLDAASAAIMAMMFVDQMPVSIPWLTGCAQPRTAGCLTPGSPASFRRLVMEMGDTRPPVMKLKDAV